MGRTYPPRHADQVLEIAQSGDAAAHSMVAASWRRSLLSHGLEPDTKRQAQYLSYAELRKAREAIDPLLAVAQPTLDRLFQSVGDTGCCVLLTDKNGVIVDRRSSVSDDKIFSQWGLRTGAVWSEALEGTNGIGTCLAEQRPVAIHRDEHFYSRNTDMSCMDAPIFDHEGKLVAALDVSSCRADHTERVASLVSAVIADAAKKIETDYFHETFRDSRIVLVGSSPGNNGQMLLAVDRDDLVIGATRAARLAFGLTNESFRSPRPAADILCGQEQKADLLAAERSEIQRALARADGNMSATAQALGIGRATLYRRMKRLGLSNKP